MTFEDLPDNASRLPISGPTMAADLVDLFVGWSARQRGCLLLAPCDEEDVVLTAVLVEDVPMDGEHAKLANLLDHLAPMMPGLLFGLGRPGHPRLTDEDRAWHQVVLDATRRHDIRLLGAFLATDDDVTAFPDWSAELDATA